MAKFLFWSDLHCEFAPFDIPKPAEDPGAHENAPGRDDIDAVLMAGDTHIKARGIAVAEEVWKIWKVPVLMIGGNHEGYGSKYIQKIWRMEDEKIAAARERGADIQMMRGDARVIGDTRVIGATLWTDLKLYPESFSMVQHAVREEMNDYNRIRILDERRGIYRKLQPSDTMRMHSSDKAAIFKHLNEPFDGYTVVMTHHMPLAQMISPAYRDKPTLVTAAYASDLAEDIRAYDIDAWICGHSHNAVEYVLDGDHGEIKFLRNARGYPGEKTDFNPVRILDSSAPLLACAPAYSSIAME